MCEATKENTTVRVSYGVKEAAAYMAVTERFIRRLVLEGRIRYYKLGKYVRFEQEDLDAFIDAGRVDSLENLWNRGAETAMSHG
ncbi:helix-turn-helix domain-containing protein [Glycomyces tenuis]|uniref:helix-turn-helix domain-containing protein n=1 Tax=Glycomyces tenuis TaxID=58116 RepID=UPI0004183719|nr:helix-turn-helix domain-containing protein [Glycomyces tenuis]